MLCDADVRYNTVTVEFTQGGISRNLKTKKSVVDERKKLDMVTCEREGHWSGRKFNDYQIDKLTHVKREERECKW